MLCLCVNLFSSVGTNMELDNFFDRTCLMSGLHEVHELCGADTSMEVSCPWCCQIEIGYLHTDT